MRPTRRHLLPAFAAAVMALGLVSSASATANPATNNDTRASEDVSASTAGIGFEVLKRLLGAGILPDGARATIARFAGEEGELAHPGFACRRVSENPDADPALVERCRNAIDGDRPERPEPGAICRRVAEHPEAAPELVQRCREWAADHQQGHDRNGAAAACRRVAQDPEAHPTLVQRCRAWLDAHDGSGHAGASICRRVAQHPEASPELAERCRDLLAGDGDGSGLSACRRVAGAADVDPALVERCRDAISSDGGTLGPRVRDLTPTQREGFRARDGAAIASE